jgi:hypothetical protein
LTGEDGRALARLAGLRGELRRLPVWACASNIFTAANNKAKVMMIGLRILSISLNLFSSMIFINGDGNDNLNVRRYISGCAARLCGKASPFRLSALKITARLRLAEGKA